MSIALFALIIVFLCYGFYLLFKSGFLKVFLITLLVIIVLHASIYINKVKIGDRLFVCLTHKRYEISYKHKKIEHGEFSQNDIEIHHVDDGETEIYRVIFLPAENADEIPSIKRVELFQVDVSMYIEMNSDLGAIFQYLNMPYDQGSWNIT